VKSLRALPPLKPVGNRNEVVIAFLREALELAERGEISGVVLVLEHADGSTSDRCALRGHTFPQMLIGALSVAQSRMIARYMSPDSGVMR
jgi:hypothetical protein